MISQKYILFFLIALTRINSGKTATSTQQTVILSEANSYQTTQNYASSSIGQTTAASTLDNRTLVIKAITTLNELSVDGVDRLLISTNGLYYIHLPENTRLYTFVASIPSTEYPCVGLLASVADYMETNRSSCKCTSTPGNDYTHLGFDDSSWLNAFEYGSNDGQYCGYPTYPSISASSRWIWADNSSINRVVSFCRCYTNLCDRQNPCLNGGVCNKNAIDICTCGKKWTGKYCEIEMTDAFAVTAKESLQSLYVDGVMVTPLDNANDWQLAMSLQIQSYSKLIAISASNIQNLCSGILASVNGNTSFTDANWKCTGTNYFNWFSLEYDDSAWDRAAVVGNNTAGINNCPSTAPVAGIGALAKWIWTSSSAGNTLVYCRGVLPVCNESPCVNGGKCNNGSGALCSCPLGFSGKYCEITSPLLLSISGLYNLDGVFIDGVEVGLSHAGSYDDVDKIAFNPLSRLISVYGQAIKTPNNSCHGLIADVRLNDVPIYLSNSSWSCATNTNAGWYKLGFTDSLTSATVLGSNGALPNCPVKYLPAISVDAKIIWSTSNVVTFCRFLMPICSNQPCQNGGICNANSELLCTCRPGYTGQFCEIIVTTMSKTTSVSPDCGNHGYHVIQNGKLKCKCLAGFSGNNCKEVIERCGVNTCIGRGSCRNRDFGIVCSCDQGFSGLRCERLEA